MIFHSAPQNGLWKCKGDADFQHYVENIKKAIGESRGSTDHVEELVSDGKSHDPYWLVGRHAKSAKVSTTASIDSYIHDLTMKIRQNLAEEVKTKVKQKVQKVQDEVDANVNRKVQENLTWTLKKLVDANPDMKTDLGDICATISTDDNDNGTPMMGGARF